MIGAAARFTDRLEYPAYLPLDAAGETTRGTRR